MYNYLLFDWDGTLAQTLQIHLNAYKATFAEHGIFPTDLEITQKVFGDWQGPVKLGVTNIEAFSAAYIQRVNETFVDAPLYPGAEEVLEFFKSQGKKIALVTTGTITLVEPALAKNKMAHYFDAVLTADDVSQHKPHPEIIFTALQKLGGSPEQAVIIGDSKSDLGAANNAGISSVLFSPAEHTVFYDKDVLVDTYSPTHVIAAHAELEKLFYT